MNQANQIAAIVAPIATGYLATWTHSFAAAFSAAGIILFLGIASYILLLGRIERIPVASLQERLPA
jgi:dipeptide/tripeptide permease